MLWLLRAGGQVLLCTHTQFACHSHLGRTGSLSLTNNHNVLFSLFTTSFQAGESWSPLPFPLVFIRVTEILSNWAPPRGDLCALPTAWGWPSPGMSSPAGSSVTQECQKGLLASGDCHSQILVPKDKLFHFWDNLSLLNPKHFLTPFHKIWWPMSCQRGYFFICFCSPLRSPSLTSAATAEDGRNAFVFGLENDNFSRLF